MFKALKERNYRLFFSGQFVSLLGSWVANTAMSWLVYDLTNSAFLMGMITFINALPSLLLMPFAGVVIDKVNQYKMMIFLQVMLMFWAILLAALTIVGVIEVWHIVVLGLFANAVMAFDMPLRQAFVVKLVSKKELLNNAISLNAVNFNLARLIGPAVAGVLIAKFSEGVCFLLNAISFIAVVFALLLINVDDDEKRKAKKINYFKEIKEGLVYIKNCSVISTILLFLTITSFTAGIYSLITPIYVKELLSGDPKEMGYLMSCMGIGSLLGSLYVASKKHKKEFVSQIIAGSFVFAICFILLSFIHLLWIDMILMFLSGLGMSCVMIGCNTTIQNAVDNAKRGRVMSFYSLTFVATVPLGHLFWGQVIDIVGLASSLLVAGGVLLAITIIFIPRLEPLARAY